MAMWSAPSRLAARRASLATIRDLPLPDGPANTWTPCRGTAAGSRCKACSNWLRTAVSASRSSRMSFTVSSSRARSEAGMPASVKESIRAWTSGARFRPLCQPEVFWLRLNSRRRLASSSRIRSMISRPRTMSRSCTSLALLLSCMSKLWAAASTLARWVAGSLGAAACGRLTADITSAKSRLLAGWSASWSPAETAATTGLVVWSEDSSMSTATTNSV